MTTTELVATPQEKTIPAEALRFDCGPMEFIEADEVVENEAPITMFARSAKPIEHPFWGKIVHDMAGMRLLKDRIPIDWCHNERNNVGYLDQFDASNKGLTVTGKLIAFTAGDKASEIMHRGKKGVPYESSISFRGPTLRIEELGPGVTAQVNGYELEGPAVIIREWNLRAVAVCPYGADHHTVSEFADQNSHESLTVEVMSMTKPTPQQQPSEQNSTELGEAGGQTSGSQQTPETPTVDRAAFTGELDKYIDAFGTDYGLQWYREGKTFAESIELHNKQLAAALAEREEAHAKQLEELKSDHEKQLAERDAKLKAFSDELGEHEPASFGDAEGQAGGDNKQLTDLQFKLGKNLGAFAGGIKVPAKAD